jgi:hypothetical protein
MRNSSIIVLILFASLIAPEDDAGAARTANLRAEPARQVDLAAFGDGRTLLVFAHQDDDLLWMLPFWPAAEKFLLSAYPAPAKFHELVTSFPPEADYEPRWTPIWGAVDPDIYADVFTDKCKRATIVAVETIKAHLRPYLMGDTKRVVTHNPWGEYGHAQHRMVSQAVRELAVERGLDVWALGVRVHYPQERDRGVGYENVAASIGLPTIEGSFDDALFKRIRSEYLARRFEASTPELNRKLKGWSPTLWTWATGPEAYPTGWRPFIKLVEAGKDLASGSQAIQRMASDMPVINGCDKP